MIIKKEIKIKIGKLREDDGDKARFCQWMDDICPMIQTKYSEEMLSCDLCEEIFNLEHCHKPRISHKEAEEIYNKGIAQ